MNQAMRIRKTVKNIEPTRPDSVDRLLTIQQAAAYLNVPARTLGEKARLREVPFTRIFKHVRFSPADIAEIVAKGREGIMSPLDSPRHPSSGRGVL